MKASDPTPRNPGMAKGVAGDFEFAVKEARLVICLRFVAFSATSFC
jgi:hypothetical protein